MNDFMEGRHPAGRGKVHDREICKFVRSDDRTVCRFCGRPGSFRTVRTCTASHQSEPVVKSRLTRVERLSRVAFPKPDSAIRFVRNEDMARDVLGLIQLLPPNVSEVVGVARSGLMAASLVAMHLHLPLKVLMQNEGKIVDAGGGWRIKESGGSPKKGITLVVDDTVASGQSMKKTAAIVRGENVHFASVYCNPENLSMVDYTSRLLNLPHLLEWNLFNSVYLPKVMFDCDGVLCEDGRSHVPLYLPRRSPVAVCTARLHKHREATESWLRRWGVDPETLIMGPWESESHRDGKCIGTWKGEQFEQFKMDAGRDVSSPGPWMFVESEPLQARRIFERAGGLVLCTKTWKVWQ